MRGGERGLNNSKGEPATLGWEQRSDTELFNKVSKLGHSATKVYIYYEELHHFGVRGELREPPPPKKERKKRLRS